MSHWIEGAELYINAGKYEHAFAHLMEVAHLFLRSAPPGEFVRVGELLLEKSSIAAAAKYASFDRVITAMVRVLANIGRIQSALNMLDDYGSTITSKDARYVNFCDLQSYVHWRHGDFTTAVRWGTEGVELKALTGVDTKYSAEHTLALAQRDAGNIDAALKILLDSVSLEDAADTNHIDRDRGGAFYGNIGRCLHLMGQIEPALRCYQKSAQLIEEDVRDHEENRAYIRQWIGELLQARSDKRGALNFLVAARAKWSLLSPPKMASIDELIEDILQDTNNESSLDEVVAEAYCRRWISLRY